MLCRKPSTALSFPRGVFTLGIREVVVFKDHSADGVQRQIPDKRLLGLHAALEAPDTH